MSSSPLRHLPSVDKIISDPRVADNGFAYTADIARAILAEVRRLAAAGEPPPTFDVIVERVVQAIELEVAPPIRPLINATGVILQTNLGRAPLAEEAIDAMAAACRGYTNVEYDLERGERGSRHSLLEPLLTRLTGAEAAMAVNNNAAAVLLALATLATAKEVVVSRGELVEIGGGFRIPDVMRQSRAKIVEVGTTNRTRASDYRAAITPKTAALLRVHPSNFRIIGFTEAPQLSELAEIARASGVALLDDLGSGCLLDTAAYGLTHEPRPQESIAAGADVVMFSGDKLLGGPQAGLIVGSRGAIERTKKHPLARAVRLDKATIAGMAATLRLYVEGRAADRIPIWRMIATPLDELECRALAVAQATGEGARVVEEHSMIGGGSLPEQGLPSRAVALRSGDRTAAQLSGYLRRNGVVARIDKGSVLLDLRTISPSEDHVVAAACRGALA